MEQVADGQLVLHRLRRGRDMLRSYSIEIDGAKLGSIRAGQTTSLPLPLGEHVVRLKIDWCSSQVVSFVLTPSHSRRELWCCAGSSAHVEQVLVGRDHYVQIGDEAAAEAMSANAAFDIRHFAKLFAVLIVVALFLAVVLAVLF